MKTIDAMKCSKKGSNTIDIFGNWECGFSKSQWIIICRSFCHFRDSLLRTASIAHLQSTISHYSGHFQFILVCIYDCAGRRHVGGGFSIRGVGTETRHVGLPVEFLCVVHPFGF